jgi:hypothetical protein
MELDFKDRIFYRVLGFWRAISSRNTTPAAIAAKTSTRLENFVFILNSSGA